VTVVTRTALIRALISMPVPIARAILIIKAPLILEV
jgi:hypothetical protein